MASTPSSAPKQFTIRAQRQIYGGTMLVNDTEVVNSWISTDVYDFYMQPTGDEEEAFFYIHRTIQEPALLSSEPSLTVPDLEESIEQIFARRAAGIPDSSPRSLGTRVYPADPESLKSAKQMVEEMTKNLKLEQENLKQEAENLKNKRAEEAEQAKKEKEMYKAFKEEKERAKTT